jgi:predicted DNA-binding WGR domain protein
MPLSKGSSKATISKNIAELIRAWKKTGKIGTAHPKNLKQAQEMAVAIAHSKARSKKK